MRAIADFIDGFNMTVGRWLSWLALLIVLVQFGVVLARYVFGIGSIWAQESITYMHGFLFMLAAAYTLKLDGHVRVDIFYRDADPRTKAKVNMGGALLFLIPVCILIFYVAYPYVAQSWSILEGSQETSGIQGRYLQKTAILAFAVMMALQGVAIILRSILALGGDERELEALKTPMV
ncbi:MAG: TRAP transporter small permease subunit [Rhodobiaceae bacterium]|nr:TRAP transporter small permease subunit [Rhodobiaceae bacterium]MCC0057177.1 TRAP transporter small permease subunit [Rhodobiaceae bacterium]